MFKLIQLLYGLLGNFGLAILRGDGDRQGRLLPARQPLLRVDGGDAERAAGDEGTAGALQGRPRGAAAGDDGALQDARRSIRSRAAWPMVIQIPVFFSLYKVLFITIEMRHAPFFGWIQRPRGARSDQHLHPVRADPVGPDRVPVIGAFPHLGIWPLIMGVTMWLQMRSTRRRQIRRRR